MRSYLHHSRLLEKEPEDEKEEHEQEEIRKRLLTLYAIYEGR
jgi:hypothetical protein